MSEAVETKLVVKVLKWGNSMGLRVSRKDASAAGLREGDEIVIEFAPPRKKVDLSHLHSFDMGGDLSIRHDEVDWA
jgi:hypothetical protein